MPTTTSADDAAAPRRVGWSSPAADVRLVVGVLLVLLSVAGGIRLVASLDDTTPVYAATRDLLPGQPVGEGDVVAVPVRMEEYIARYVDGSAPLQPGTHLLRQVRAGELVPAAALGTAREALDKTMACRSTSRPHAGGGDRRGRLGQPTRPRRPRGGLPGP